MNETSDTIANSAASVTNSRRDLIILGLTRAISGRNTFVLIKSTIVMLPNLPSLTNKF